MQINKIKLGAIIASALIGFSSSAETLKVAGKPTDAKLHLNLVKEVVARSDRYDGIEFVYAKTGEPARTRVLEDLKTGKLDIYWSATNETMESDFTPIYFPIFRGMLGMRIGLIHEKDASLLQDVKTIEDLKKLSICSGKTWPDTEILEFNDLNVAKSLKYPNIFEMLVAGNRCDLFARGVMEPFSEKANHLHLPIDVDKHLMLRYKMPYMLFVKKGNEDMAEHITGIIEGVFEDGTYEKLFFSDPEINDALSKAKLHKRNVVVLDTPNLTEEVQAIPEKYYYNPFKNQNIEDE